MTTAVHGRTSWTNSDKPSRVTVPANCRHPLIRIVFGEMRRQSATYEEVAHRSGVLTSTLKSWRKEKAPSFPSIEATLGSLGWRLVPTPRPDMLPAEIREAIAPLIPLFRSEEEVLATAIAAAAALPSFVRDQIAGMAAHRMASFQPQEIAA